MQFITTFMQGNVMDVDGKITLVAALVAAIGTLAGVVGALWSKVNSQQKAYEENHLAVLRKLDDCEKDRTSLWEKIADMMKLIGGK